MRSTYIGLVLDESGSMYGVKDDVIGGVNAYLDTLLEEGHGDAFFALNKFRTVGRAISIQYICEGVHIADAPRMNDTNYKPCGGTPLIDAVMDMIKKVGERVLMWDTLLPPKVIIVVQTDGYENSSKKYTWDGLKREISSRRESGWQFVFLGADIDASEQGGKLGAAQQSTLSYSSDRTGETFSTTAEATSRYLRGDSDDVEYTEEERKLLGSK